MKCNKYNFQCVEDWQCPKCNCSRRALRDSKIWRLSNVLVIHLMRFTFVDGVTAKNSTPIKFEINDHNMGRYLHPRSPHNDQTNYHLRAAVVSADA